MFIYFINAPDVDGATTQVELEDAIHLLEEFIGIRRNHALRDYVIDAFVDVTQLQASQS